MKSPISIAWGLLLLPLATAHFDLNYPGAREADHANQGQFPCGGSNTPSAERSDWSLQGDRIEMRSGHTRTAVQVLLALGNDPGSNFNITLLPTLLQEGPGVLCLPRLRLPEGVRVEDGTNATIQVAADGKTGLYNCADVTLRDAPAQPGSCTNGTGVSTRALDGPPRNANETTIDDHSGDGEASGSATGSASPAATSGNAAPRNALGWGMGGVAAALLGYAVLI